MIFDLRALRAPLRAGTAHRCIALAAMTGAAPATAQDVIPDGRTNTSVTVNGAISDVRTGTLVSAVGVSALRQLNASAGRIVTVHVPTGADTTINLVRDRASRIDRTLNSVRNGQIGGTMILANPNGVIVGAGGGSTRAASPSPPRRRISSTASSTQRATWRPGRVTR